MKAQMHFTRRERSLRQEEYRDELGRDLGMAECERSEVLILIQRPSR